jgi:hypothetical protein
MANLTKFKTREDMASRFKQVSDDEGVEEDSTTEEKEESQEAKEAPEPTLEENLQTLADSWDPQTPEGEEYKAAVQSLLASEIVSG